MAEYTALRHVSKSRGFVLPAFGRLIDLEAAKLAEYLEKSAIFYEFAIHDQGHAPPPTRKTSVIERGQESLGSRILG